MFIGWTEREKPRRAQKEKRGVPVSNSMARGLQSSVGVLSGLSHQNSACISMVAERGATSSPPLLLDPATHYPQARRRSMFPDENEEKNE